MNSFAKVAPVVSHSARTALAAVASLLVARMFRLPEAYWAPITTVMVTQSSVGAALVVSWQRFAGTLLGAVLGAIVTIYFGPHAVVFGAGVFLLGLLCAIVRSDRTAYRFGGITLAIVLLIPRTAPGWRIAFDRLAEVSIGICVALIFAFVWPEKDLEPAPRVSGPPIAKMTPRDVNQMPHVVVERPETQSEINILTDEQNTITGRIRLRASELFEESGEARGNDDENWLKAEEELLQIPTAKLESRDGSYFLHANIAGHHEQELKVAALPTALIVIAEPKHRHSKNHLASIGAKRIFHRVDLIEPIDTQSVHATFENGLLKVSAKKLSKQ